MPVRTISWLSIRPFEDLNFDILTMRTFFEYKICARRDTKEREKIS